MCSSDLVSEVCAALDAAGVPAAPVATLVDALATPQAAARGILQAVEDPRLPGLRLPTQPVKFTGSGANVARRAPALGEDSVAVFSDLLGLGAERIAELAEAGVFGQDGAQA